MTVQLLLPPGRDALPVFEQGWLDSDGSHLPFLSYIRDGADRRPDGLEALLDERSRSHFIDVWTREVLLQAIAGVPTGGTIADLGCSAGYLLTELGAAYPEATVVGVDLVGAGLAKAHELIPTALLIQADVCALPFADNAIDAIVSGNLLEHVLDDRKALAETARVLTPGGTAAFVVPSGPGTYDYYDRYLGHERRYARGELALKARAAGLTVLEDRYIGSLLYPAFWLVKKRNRRWYERLEGTRLEQRVRADIARTSDSRVGAALRRIEDGLRVRLPFGVRNLVVVRRGRS